MTSFGHTGGWEGRRCERKYDPVTRSIRAERTQKMGGSTSGGHGHGLPEYAVEVPSTTYRYDTSSPGYNPAAPSSNVSTAVRISPTAPAMLDAQAATEERRPVSSPSSTLPRRLLAFMRGGHSWPAPREPPRLGTPLALLASPPGLGLFTARLFVRSPAADVGIAATRPPLPSLPRFLPHRPCPRFLASLLLPDIPALTHKDLIGSRVRHVLLLTAVQPMLPVWHLVKFHLPRG